MPHFMFYVYSCLKTWSLVLHFLVTASIVTAEVLYRGGVFPFIWRIITSCIKNLYLLINAPCTVQAVCPIVIGVERTAPVLQLQSEVHDW